MLLAAGLRPFLFPAPTTIATSGGQDISPEMYKKFALSNPAIASGFKVTQDSLASALDALPKTVSRGYLTGLNAEGEFKSRMLGGVVGGAVGVLVGAFFGGMGNVFSDMIGGVFGKVVGVLGGIFFAGVESFMSGALSGEIADDIILNGKFDGRDGGIAGCEAGGVAGISGALGSILFFPNSMPLAIGSYAGSFLLGLSVSVLWPVLKVVSKNRKMIAAERSEVQKRREIEGFLSSEDQVRERVLQIFDGDVKAANDAIRTFSI